MKASDVPTRARLLHRAAKYGIRGSRVAAARAAVAMLERMIGAYGPQARLKEHWQEIENFAASGIEHVPCSTAP